jgi:hypothetical protein
MMTKTAAALLIALSATLAACGGGGDDGDAGSADLVSTKTAGSEPDRATRFTNDWLVTYQSTRSETGLTGDIRYRACVTGIWRQTLRADATLRLTISVFGQPARTIDNIAGKAGAGNVITFQACGDTFTKAVQPFYPQGSATFQLQAMTNRAAFPVDGYDVEINWTVTQL